MAPVNAKPKPRRQTAASAFTAPLLSSFVSCFVVREHPALPQPNTGGRAGPAGLSISQAVPPQEGRKEPWEDGEKPLTCGRDRERRLARTSAEDASRLRGFGLSPEPRHIFLLPGGCRVSAGGYRCSRQACAVLSSEHGMGKIFPVEGLFKMEF